MTDRVHLGSVKHGIISLLSVLLSRPASPQDASGMRLHVERSSRSAVGWHLPLVRPPYISSCRVTELSPERVMIVQDQQEHWGFFSQNVKEGMGRNKQN